MISAGFLEVRTNDWRQRCKNTTTLFRHPFGSFKRYFPCALITLPLHSLLYSSPEAPPLEWSSKNVRAKSRTPASSTAPESTPSFFADPPEPRGRRSWCRPANIGRRTKVVFTASSYAIGAGTSAREWSRRRSSPDTRLGTSSTIANSHARPTNPTTARQFNRWSLIGIGLPRSGSAVIRHCATRQNVIVLIVRG